MSVYIVIIFFIEKLKTNSTDWRYTIDRTIEFEFRKRLNV